MKKLATIFILIISWGIMSSTAEAQIWIVNNNPGGAGDYSDAQLAHDNASVGDTLYLVPSGEDYSLGNIDKELHIYGNGYWLVENGYEPANNEIATLNITSIQAANTSINSIVVVQNNYLEIESNDVIISACLIDATVDVNSSQRTIIEKSIITGQLRTAGSDGIIVNSMVHGSFNFNGTITNNIIHDFSGTGNGNSTINNNIFLNNESISELFNPERFNTVTHNIFVGPDNGYSGNNNQFNVDESTLFVGSEGNSTDGQWMLSDTSPAKGAGTNGDDIGMYGGANPYQLSGLPDIPRITAFTAPATGSSNTGLPVSITIESNN